MAIKIYKGNRFLGEARKSKQGLSSEYYDEKDAPVFDNGKELSRKLDNTRKHHAKQAEKKANSPVGKIKKFVKDTFSEARQPDKFDYTDQPGKVSVDLTGDASGAVTRLTQNYKKIEILEEQLKELKEQKKSDLKATVADYFDEVDSALTRVVRLKSAIEITISKDPKQAETVAWKSVVEELANHLSPELIEVMETIKKTHTSIGAAKDPSIKVRELTEDSDENLGKTVFNSWLKSFDKRLNNIKRMLKNG